MSDRQIDPEELRMIISSDDQEARARALIELGTYYIGEGNYSEAHGCFGSAADLYAELDLPVELMNALRYLGDNQAYHQGRHEEAVENYRRVLELATEVGDTRNMAYGAGAMGDALRELNRLDEALDAHERAVAAFSELDEPYMVGVNLISVGSILYRRNQTKAAAEKYSLAYNQFQIAGNPLRAGFAKDMLSDALAAQGEYEEALSHIDDVIGILNILAEEDAQRNAQYSKALLLLESGRTTEAAAMFLDLAFEFREAKRFNDCANAELGYLVARFRENFIENWVEAKRGLPRVRAYFDAAGLGVNVVKADRFLAEWYSLQEAWPRVVQILRRVVTRCQELDEPNLERSSRARLANALIEIGEYQEAQQVLADVHESQWGDVKVEIDFLHRVKETLEIRLAPEAD